MTHADRSRRDAIARRAARDIPDGAFVNLGVGIPTSVANFLVPGREIICHSENGILGVGPAPDAHLVDPDLMNASRQHVTLLPGASIFHHADSFAMIRGGHIDIAILGAFQVSSTGDLANWSTGLDGVPAVGGAMDLAVGAKSVWVLMEHRNREGISKLVERCTYPLTAVGAARRVYTDLAVIDITPEGPVVREIAAGFTFDALQGMTDARLKLAADWQPAEVA